MRKSHAICTAVVIGCALLPCTGQSLGAAIDHTSHPSCAGRPILGESAAEKETIGRELRAIWQVVAYDSTYEPTGIATAFAVSESLLATNAHVVDAVVEALGEDGRAFVVQHQTGLRHEIVSAWRHPGYQSDEMPGPDVGLFRVEESLADVLPLASSETVRSVSVADEVRMYGFPGDLAIDIDKADELWGLDRPRATAGFGRITAIRPLYASDDGTPENSLLIQHDIRSVGGNSGSPVLNKQGSVVGITWGGRDADGGSGLGLAVRADVLRPLLDMVTTGVLPFASVAPSEESTEPASSNENLLSNVAALLDTDNEWAITLPAGIIVAAGLVGLVALQRARFGYRRHRDLIARLDRFVEAIHRRLNDAPPC